MAVLKRYTGSAWEDVGAGQSGTSGLWTSWTPALTAVTTNPNLGATGTATGRHVQVGTGTGSTVHGWANFTFAGAGAAAGSGEYRISLPVAPRQDTGLVAVGSGLVYPGSGNVRIVTCFLVPSTNVVKMYIDGTTGVTHAVPAAWVATGEIRIEFSYEVA